MCGFDVRRLVPGDRRRQTDDGAQSRLLERSFELSDGAQKGWLRPDAERSLAAASARMYDVYLCHCHTSGADQCRILAMLLRDRGLQVWYDMDANDLTLAGMEHGVRNSRNFLVFLSKGTMGRPYCHQEMRWAKSYGCRFLGVMEHDEQHGRANIDAERAVAPDDLKHLLQDVEFITNQRRSFLVTAMVDELERRCNA